MVDFATMFGVSIDNSDRLVNYHCHTEDSNSKQPDGIVHFKEYVRRAIELGHKCVSTCEHGSSGDLLDKFYWKNKCGKLHYTDRDGNRQFKAILADSDKSINKAKMKLEADQCTNFDLEMIDLNLLFVNEIYFKYDTNKKRGSHLVLIAKNILGVNSINKNLAHVVKNKEGFWGIDDLQKLDNENVIVTTACLASPIRKRDDGDDHEKVFEFLYNHFKENLFLEVQANTAPEQAEWNKYLQYLSQKFGVKLIAGCDSHYIYEKQYKLRQILLSAKGISYEEEDAMILDYPSRKKLFDRFKKQNVLSDSEINQAINNTLIFEEGTLGLQFNTEIKIPSIYKDKNNENNDFLLQMQKGYERLTLGKSDAEKKQYMQELQREISVVSEGGMIPYLMTAHNIVKLAQKGKIQIEDREYILDTELGLLTKTGRGSGAGPLTNNALEFTTLDRLDCEVPMLFERFISLDRLKQKVLMD